MAHSLGICAHSTGFCFGLFRFAAHQCGYFRAADIVPPGLAGSIFALFLIGAICVKMGGVRTEGS